MSKRKPSDLVNEVIQESHEVEIAKLKTDAAKWNRKCKEATRTAIEMEARLDIVLGMDSDTHTQVFKRARKSKTGTVAVIAPASDWHIEERVFKAAVGGKNEFNLTIAEARVKRFYRGIIEEIELQNHSKKVGEIWHPLLGDLLTGYIHEELVESNSLSPTEACVFLQELICSGIDFLLRETKLPIYIPTCCGNHSRTTDKKRIKTSYQNSYEWLLANMLAKYYASNPRVTFMISEGYHNIQTIMERKVRFHHGDAMRYAGGIGGITIPVAKAIAQWQKLEQVDFDIFGHFHQFAFGYPYWIACPCLIGFSEFALEIKANFEHPSQIFIVVDREYGIIQAKPIFLTDPWRKQKGKRR